MQIHGHQTKCKCLREKLWHWQMFEHSVWVLVQPHTCEKCRNAPPSKTKDKEAQIGSVFSRKGQEPIRSRLQGEWQWQDEAWRTASEPSSHAHTHVQSPPTPALYSPCSCKTGTCAIGWSFFCASPWLAAWRRADGQGMGMRNETNTKTKWVSMIFTAHMQKQNQRRRVMAKTV